MKKTGKRLMATALVLAVTITPMSAFALLEPTGPTMSTAEGIAWLQTESYEANVHRYLDGNYAFAADISRAWAVDRKLELETPCYLKKGTEFESYALYIPASAVKQVFGMDIGTEYISAKKLANQLGKEFFFDPRGFALIGDNLDIHTKYNSNVTAYDDYYTADGAIAYIMWDDISPTEEDYTTYIDNWKKLITLRDVNDENYTEYKQTIVDEAYIYNEMVSLNDGIGGVFNDTEIPETHPAMQTPLTTTFERLVIMAKACYLTEYQDEELVQNILGGIEELYKFYSLEIGLKTAGGWTQYAIDHPYMYSNLLALMSDYLTQEDLVRHTNAVYDRCPDSVVGRGSWGAARNITNRIWMSTAYLNNAILARDEYRINHALKYLSEGFSYNTAEGYEGLDMTQDGYYESGATVFHSSIAYALGYTESHLQMISELLMHGEGTCFDIQRLYNYDNIYDIIVNNFMCYYIENVKDKHVTGRWDPISATSCIARVMTIVNHAPEEEKPRLCKAINEAIYGYEDTHQKAVSGVNGRYTSYVSYDKEIEEYWSYAKNYPVTEAPTYNVAHPETNRMVHRRSDFTVSLGMASERIEKYEALASSKTAHEWYIGDSSLFVYSGDNKYLNGSWIKKADKYRIPGTTVDSTVRGEETTERKLSRGLMPNNSWAGVISDGTNGMGSVILGNSDVSNLMGKKSYFMLGDNIICLGSGISGGEGAATTTIDQRSINEKISEVGDLEIKEELAIKEISGSWGSASDFVALYDGDGSTGTGTNVMGAYFQIELEDIDSLGGFAIAFSKGNIRNQYFDVLLSEDGVNFSKANSYISSGITENYEFFALSGKAKYLRFVNQGNSTSGNWMTPMEFRIYRTGVDVDALNKSFNVPIYGYEDILVDGKPAEILFNEPKSYDADTAYLEDFGGWVIMDDNQVTVNRYYSNGATYAEITIEHGIAKDESYAYAILPHAEQKDLDAFKENPPVEIIENSTDRHVVKDLETGIIAAACYGTGMVEDIRVKTPCLLMINKNENCIYVEEPTRKLNEVVLVLPEGYTVRETENIKVDGSTVTIKTGTHTAETFKIAYTLPDDESSIKTQNTQIRMKGYHVSTKLYADANGEAVNFALKNAAENGKAYIENGILYYYTTANTAFEEDLKIEASTVNGEKKIFHVYISK